MTDANRSAAAIVEKWLMRAESVAAAIPSWIPSGRHEMADVVAAPLASLESALARAASVAPPSMVRGRSSLAPSFSPLISIHPEPQVISYPDLRDENALLRAQLGEMAASMVRLRSEVLEASEGELVRLASAIAERAVGHELRAAPALAIAWAREAVDAIGAKEDVVIAVGPDLAALIDPEDWSAQIGASVRIETDPSLGAFGCEVRTRASVVDASPRGRVGAIARELGVRAE
jgi:hypothetical protein